MLSLRNSNHDHPVDLYDLEGSDEGDVEIDSLTKEPLDTHLMGDEVISTTPATENDEFIMSSVDDLVPIPRESEAAPIEALYGRKCRSPVYWTKVGGDQILGPELIQETIKKIVQIKQGMQAAHDR
nr:putative reverse transcriptase domain-containing protein [Tanacetum cinerariifolium]